MATAPSDKIDSLTYPLNQSSGTFNTSSQPPRTFTYEFESSQPADLSMPFSGWQAFTNEQKQVVQSVLAEYSFYANVAFREVVGDPDPDINLGRAAFEYGGIGGFSLQGGTLDGFAIVNAQYSLLTPDHRNIVIHEIGHALTLKHTGNYDAGGEQVPGPFLPFGEDNNKYTVMSYNPHPATGLESDHLMLYDIAALQSRFGANLTSNLGDDVYTGPAGRIQVIWDAGGIDTIDGSRWGNTVIDLREGSFSSLGGTDNMAVAYGAVIENAIGSSGSDILYGNEGANTIVAQSGADMIFGGDGADLIYGNQGDDLIYGNQGSDAVFGGRGFDTVQGGKAEDLIYGNFENDLIYGNMENDVLWGGQGDDRIYGGQGDDLIFGNRGDDVLFGNAGADRFVFDAGPGRDTIVDFNFAQGDRLILSGQSFAVHEAAGGLDLYLSGGGVVHLEGIEPADFSTAYLA